MLSLKKKKKRKSLRTGELGSNELEKYRIRGISVHLSVLVFTSLEKYWSFSKIILLLIMLKFKEVYLHNNNSNN